MSSEWAWKRLGDNCIKVGSGATPTGGKDAYLDHGPFMLIRSQNVYSDGFKSDGLAFISAEQARKLDGVSVEPGDVLLNITGDSVARVCLALPQFLPARVNQHVAIIRPKSSVFDSRFVRYFLASAHQHELMLGMAAAGATRSALTKSMIEDFKVPCPPIDVQREIADVLSSLDDRITLLRETNATLEAIAQALFKSWFVDFDPVRAKMGGRAPEGMDEATAALFPDSFKESELGLMPTGWQLCVVSDVAKLFSGGTPDTRKPEYWGGDLRWFSSGETRNLVVVDTEKRINLKAVENSSTKLAVPGDILIASAGQGHTRGQTSYCAISTYINQSVISVRANAQECGPLWLFNNLIRRYPEMRDLSDSHSSRGSLTTKLLGSMPILLPSKDVLSAFEAVASTLMNSLVGNSQTVQTLATLRDTLLPRLISGQLRLPEAQLAVAEEAVA